MFSSYPLPIYFHTFALSFRLAISFTWVTYPLPILFFSFILNFSTMKTWCMYIFPVSLAIKISGGDKNLSSIPTLLETIDQEVCIHLSGLYQENHEDIYICIDHIVNIISSFTIFKRCNSLHCLGQFPCYDYSSSVVLLFCSADFHTAGAILDRTFMKEDSQMDLGDGSCLVIFEFRHCHARALGYTSCRRKRITLYTWAYSYSSYHSLRWKPNWAGRLCQIERGEVYLPLRWQSGKYRHYMTNEHACQLRRRIQEPYWVDISVFGSEILFPWYANVWSPPLKDACPAHAVYLLHQSPMKERRAARFSHEFQLWGSSWNYIVMSDVDKYIFYSGERPEAEMIVKPMSYFTNILMKSATFHDATFSNVWKLSLQELRKVSTEYTGEAHPFFQWYKPRGTRANAAWTVPISTRSAFPALPATRLRQECLLQKKWSQD